MKEQYYCIHDSVTFKFVARINTGGKITLVMSPYKSNFFGTEKYAKDWATESGLTDKRYTVVKFERIKG